jgi:electron transfer flavoprotein beta subunit
MMPWRKKVIMRIIVLVKQVPDMENVTFDRVRGVVDRNSAGTEINPFDLNALETAVSIAEQNGAEVSVLSMGPPTCETALREAIARGADHGYLLSDRKFGGADVRATSMTLAAGIRKIGDFDLILCGMQTVDGDTGQVGAEVAEMLGIPHMSYAEKLNAFDEETITVTSSIWEGTYLRKMRFPLLVTVTKEINVPRMPTFKNKMKARSAVIVKWGAEDLAPDLAEGESGLKGSSTRVKRIEVPPAAIREGRHFRSGSVEALDTLVDVFMDKKLIKEVNHDA